MTDKKQSIDRLTALLIKHLSGLGGDEAERRLQKLTHLMVAEKIADSLFLNGSGDVATRLKLEQGKRDLGGWCKQAVINNIILELDKFYET